MYLLLLGIIISRRFVDRAKGRNTRVLVLSQVPTNGCSFSPSLSRFSFSTVELFSLRLHLFA